jgi:hypothetical protein
VIVAEAETSNGDFSVGRHESILEPGRFDMCVVTSAAWTSPMVRVEPWDSPWAVEFRARLRDMGVEVRDYLA